MPVFPESAGLKAILESRGWTLYEMNELADRCFNFGSIQNRGPAAEYETGKQYYLFPILGPGESLEFKMSTVRPPTLFTSRLIDLGRYCTIKFQDGAVLVQPIGQPIELPNAIAVAAFREGFCKTPQGKAAPK